MTTQRREKQRQWPVKIVAGSSIAADLGRGPRVVVVALVARIGLIAVTADGYSYLGFLQGRTYMLSTAIGPVKEPLIDL
jgi:hypothetical protein